jgi:peptide/nickel transport system permease protein
MSGILRNLRQITSYPSAVAGLLIILSLIVVSIYTVITIPYSEAVRLWRGGEDIWSDYPKTAPPVWTNWLSGTNLPETIVLSDEDESVTQIKQSLSEDIDEEITTYSFDFPYDAFPEEISVFINAKFEDRGPHVSMTWHTPDGREIRVGELTPRRSDTYRLSQDSSLTRRLNGLPAEQGLFATDIDSTSITPLKGTYELEISSLFFEEGSDVETKLVVYGRVHGLAGTDHRRRDLMVALLWGTPIALSFGLLAAVGTTVTTMIIAAVGVWFGRVTDAIIQRITEVNLILPVLPILIMIGTFYSRSIWLMLGVLILLNIFSGGIKSYRAIFLQVREAPYIEAAQAYGAGNVRIIFNYLVPRILPLLVPQLVILIPTFVFIEASLAVLGLGDPVLPTWGKIINDARGEGALFNAQYYWVLEPAVLLMLAGLGFALVGFALDRIFNPRLRGL